MPSLWVGIKMRVCSRSPGKAGDRPGASQGAVFFGFWFLGRTCHQDLGLWEGHGHLLSWQPWVGDRAVWRGDGAQGRPVGSSLSPSEP